MVFVAVGLWYRVSVAPPNKLKSVRPYPKTARIVPINVSKWNTLKGGIDAITKLIESYRERIGIRGDCTIACERIISISLLYSTDSMEYSLRKRI